MYRTWYPGAECTFFWVLTEPSQSLTISWNLASLNMVQRIKIIQSMISDHSVIKLETHEKGKKEQNSSPWLLPAGQHSQLGHAVLLLDTNTLPACQTSDSVTLRL